MGIGKELNAREALYGFFRWLEILGDRVNLSAEHHRKLSFMLREFCSINNLPDFSEDWDKVGIHSLGKVCFPIKKDNKKKEEIKFLLKKCLEDAEH